LNVMGDGGPIAIPSDTQVTVGRDGSISTVPSSGRPTQMTPIARIKLVNPPAGEMVRGDDGLFRLRSRAAAEPDASVKVQGGAVEGSNVNVVDAMVSMIALSRQFDMQIKLLQNADSNDRQATQLLSVNR
jgi:flagellar basal-body rod protein FlgF